MSDRSLYKCEPDDPMRCQGSRPAGNGQCVWLSFAGMVRDGIISEDDPDVEYYRKAINCPAHGGRTQVKSQQQKALHGYLAQQWQKQIDEFAESEHVRTLRGEIGIIRMLIQNMLVQCRNEAELLIYSSKLADLVTRAEKLVRSCDRLEASSTTTLDRAGQIRFLSKVVDVIGKHVDGDALDAISNELMDIVKES